MLFFGHPLFIFTRGLPHTCQEHRPAKKPSHEEQSLPLGEDGRSQDSIDALCMCEQGGGGLSIYVMEELLLFPAKSEEQSRKDADGWRR